MRSRISISTIHSISIGKRQAAAAEVPGGLPGHALLELLLADLRAARRASDFQTGGMGSLGGSREVGQLVPQELVPGPFSPVSLFGWEDWFP